MLYHTAQTVGHACPWQFTELCSAICFHQFLPQLITLVKQDPRLTVYFWLFLEIPGCMSDYSGVRILWLVVTSCHWRDPHFLVQSGPLLVYIEYRNFHINIKQLWDWHDPHISILVCLYHLKKIPFPIGFPSHHMSMLASIIKYRDLIKPPFFLK